MTSTYGAGSRASAARTKTSLCLHYRPLFIYIVSGRFDINLAMGYRFVSNGSNRRKVYFVADGIYPEWRIFVGPIHDAPAGPQTDYTKSQESVRKDIERIFGVLRGRSWVLRRASEQCNVKDMVLVSEVCVMLHSLPVWIQQCGAFEEELTEEDVEVDLIEQFIL